MDKFSLQLHLGKREVSLVIKVELLLYHSGTSLTSNVNLTSFSYTRDMYNISLTINCPPHMHIYTCTFITRKTFLNPSGTNNIHTT